jgi:cytosine/adenosine deaminase-related metal-dependent hydrolase
MTDAAEQCNDDQDDREAAEHIARCREYSRRKRALLERFPRLSQDEYEKQIRRIADEVGI